MKVSDQETGRADVSVRMTVVSTIEGVALEQGKTLAPLADNVHLMDSGLDSLCIAVIVARLDDELGVDPFSGDDDMVLPVTIGDLIGIYEKAVG